jgi:hypothetical protein
MTAFISVLGPAVASIFAAVVLSGALSGIITLGLVELFLRSTLQRGVVTNLFRRANDTERSNPLTDFLNKKYQAPPPLPSGITPPAAPTPGVTGSGYSDAAITDYATSLHKAGSGAEMLANLLSIPDTTLYRLHYRQLCGQIMAAVSRESIITGDRQVFTPVIDMLAYLSSSRNSLFDTPHPATGDAPGTQPASSGFSREFPTAERLRLDVDRATREIDQLQAALSERISRYAFGTSFFVWVVAFALIAYSARRSLDFSTDVSSLLSRIAGNMVATAIALILSCVLAFASAVVASIVFAWLDRGFSSK